MSTNSCAAVALADAAVIVVAFVDDYAAVVGTSPELGRAQGLVSKRVTLVPGGAVDLVRAKAAQRRRQGNTMDLRAGGKVVEIEGKGAVTVESLCGLNRGVCFGRLVAIVSGSDGIASRMNNSLVGPLL